MHCETLLMYSAVNNKKGVRCAPTGTVTRGDVNKKGVRCAYREVMSTSGCRAVCVQVALRYNTFY